MPHQRDDLRQRRVAAGIRQHDEADQLVAKVGAEQSFAKQESREFSPDGCDTLPVVRESSLLPNRCLVEDCGDAFHKGIVEHSFADHHALLPGLDEEIARLVVDLRLVPVVVGRHREHRDRLGLRCVPMTWFGPRQTLPERKEVRLDARTLHLGDERLRILEILVPFFTESGGLQERSRDFDGHAGHNHVESAGHAFLRGGRMHHLPFWTRYRRCSQLTISHNHVRGAAAGSVRASTPC